MTDSKGKGKGKATPDEQTPLIQDIPHSYASTSRERVEDDPSPAVRRRAIVTKLGAVFLASLSAAILVFGILVLFAWSYASRASSASPESIMDDALVFRGPDRLDVLNVSTDGIWLRVDGRAAVDAGAVIGVHDDREDGFFTLVWKSLGRWGIRRLNKVSVSLDPFNITAHHSSSSVLLGTVSTQPMEISLADDPPPDSSWLAPMSVLIFVSPTTNTTSLLQFVKDAWRDGIASVDVAVPHVSLHGGGLADRSWRSAIKRQLPLVRTSISIQIPPIPGFPQPGKNVPFPSLQDLLTLESFGVKTEDKSLQLFASATVINPAPPSFNFTAPPLPFIIALPINSSFVSDVLPIASVHTQPFVLTHPNISLHIAGHVLPIASMPDLKQPLSLFLTRFLSAKPNPILITTPYFPDLPPIPALFPAQSPPPDVLRDVKLKNMKIKPRTSPTGKSTFYASGTIAAHVVLPKGFNVDLDVHQVLPDVLVFDGRVPETVEPIFGPSALSDDPKPAPPKPDLPDPLPENAFGRIRPQHWLEAESVLDRSDRDEGSAYNVTAEIVDVPMEILPGREKVFSNFVSKVIFGTEGALAGIMGTASVAVTVNGLPIGDGRDGAPEMELTGLPFKGAVRIGKRSLLESAANSLKDWLGFLGEGKPGKDFEEALDRWRRRIGWSGTEWRKRRSGR